MPDRSDSIQERDRPSRLVRPTDDRLIAGVCAGIARFFGWKPNRVRLVYVAASVLSAAFPGIIVYLVLWLLMPPEGRPRSFRLH
ncbi:MAG: PspC domain-containing protein [Longimicrobiales bacterium]|nr:PspC domain-containing protein [Longimicrobiales bacterium]